MSEVPSPQGEVPVTDATMSSNHAVSLPIRERSENSSHDLKGNDQRPTSVENEARRGLPASVEPPVASKDPVSDAQQAAHQASRDLESLDAGKVNIRFKPLPSAPLLKTKVFKINASQKFEAVVRFLKKKLECKPTDSVFCYVNSVFAPGLDENVGGLWRCLKTDDQLIVSYSLTPAFG